MSKYLFIFLATILIHTLNLALAANDFEAELQLLEKNELLLEEQRMLVIQELSASENEKIIQDSVSESRASAQKIVPEPQKTRRIRSR